MAATKVLDKNNKWKIKDDNYYLDNAIKEVNVKINNLNNLNNELQVEIEKLKKKNSVVTARMSENYTMANSGTVYQFPINTIIERTGEYLSVADGGVKIGAEVSHVLITGHIYFYTNVATGDDSIGYVQRTRNGTSTTMITQNQRFTNNYEHMTLPTKLISVEEGDIIKLGARSSTNNTLIQGTYDDGTFLTVQVID